jgi:hypothetical protein
MSDPLIIFPEGYDDQAEYEAPFKGYLQEVVVQLDDGFRFQLSFFNPVRLGQDLEAAAKLGRPYLAEPNLVVLPEVTTESIKRGVQGMWEDGFFKHLKPI